MTFHSNHQWAQRSTCNGRSDRTGRRAGLIGAGAMLAALLVASGSTLAQSQYGTEPAFRDPASGRIYTPGNVGKDAVPVPPEDRAFDPRSQQSNVPPQSTLQTPPWQAIGPVPVTAGPGSTVPALTFEASSLQPMTPGRWVLDLMVANNSAIPISPEIQCAFSNGGQVVEYVTAQLHDIPPGQRVQANIYGPESDRQFVDNAPCSTLTR